MNTNESVINMYCLSLNYKKADIDIRKKFVFSEEVRHSLSEKLKEADIKESVILCTCNRTEVYFCCADTSKTEYAEKLFAHFGETDRNGISPYIRRYFGESAALHLFRVACGIDSMIIGEDEILGQVKSAYAEALERKTADFELNTVFQSAIACAKRIKTETLLSKTSVSVATLAANEAAKLGENVKVLIIGASGKTGSAVLKNLLSHKNITVTQTIRRHKENYSIISSQKVTAADYAERFKLANEADCIISATSSPHYTITKNELEKHLTIKKSRLFIDLAVPPDIDSAVSEIEDTRIIGIDFFRKLAAENNSIKLTSAEKAEEIIKEEADEMQKKLLFHNFLPYKKAAAEKIGQMTFEELLYMLKSELGSEHFGAVLDVFIKAGGAE